MLTVTLVTAGACALINAWLAIRTSMIRRADGVSIGDGGNERLIRRMRAQANFVENAPFLLALIGLIEFTTSSSTWLWLASAAFLVARVLHPLGMDGGRLATGRNIGTGVTLFLLLALGVYAATLPFRAPALHERPVPIEALPPAAG